MIYGIIDDEESVVHALGGLTEVDGAGGLGA